MILLPLGQPLLMLLLEIAQRLCIRNLLRQQHGKGRPFTIDAVDQDLSPHELDQTPGQRQSQAGPLDIAVPADIEPDEVLEQLRPIFFLDADTRIDNLNIQDDLRIVRLLFIRVNRRLTGHTQRNGPPLRILYRIVQNINHDLAHAGWIAP